jgi:hypothetical protein
MYILRALAFFFFTQAALAQQPTPIPNFVPVCPEPEIEESVSGLFCGDFKPGLINLGAEVDGKSAVKLRDF